MQITGFAAGPLQTNCYIVVNEDTGQAAVVDPSYGAHSGWNSSAPSTG